MAFMPEHAPLVVLALLGSAAAMALAAALTFFGIVRKRPVLAQRAALGGAAVICGYLGILVAMSLGSREQVLAPGERKYFCEIDCHEAYWVAGVRRTETIGEGVQQRRAHGRFYIVTVGVEFDANTISAHRPADALLYPNPRRSRLRDAKGRELEVDAAAQQAYETTSGQTAVPFTKPLRPGESYRTDLVFDVPTEVTEPRLYITNGAGAYISFLLGHERSPLHERVLFALGDPR